MLSGVGKKPMLGIARTRSATLIQNGSQRFLVIVNAASVGPMKETMYDAELMYEKYNVLIAISVVRLVSFRDAYLSTFCVASAEVRVKTVDWNTQSPPKTARKGPAMIALVGNTREKYPVLALTRHSIQSSLKPTDNDCPNTHAHSRNQVAQKYKSHTPSLCYKAKG